MKEYDTQTKKSKKSSLKPQETLTKEKQKNEDAFIKLSVVRRVGYCEKNLNIL